MASGGFYRGITVDQDPRFHDKDKKLIESTEWPSVFSQKVTLSKVQIPALEPWVSRRLALLLGVEDDILVGLVIGYLQEKDLDPKRMQINLTPFLEGKTGEFVLELWKMLLSAQQNTLGIPKEVIEERKAELLRERQMIEGKLEQIRRIQAAEEHRKPHKSRSRSPRSYSSSRSSSSSSSSQSRRRHRRH